MRYHHNNSISRWFGRVGHVAQRVKAPETLGAEAKRLDVCWLQTADAVGGQWLG